MSKLKKARQVKRQDYEPLKPFCNYSVLLVDEKTKGSAFINSLALSYIRQINLNQDIRLAKSLFGNYIIFSDKAEPSKNRAVISTVKRKGFKTLDLTEYSTEILLDSLDITNQGLKTFAIRYLTKKPKDLIYYYLMLLKDCLEDDVFNADKAKELMKRKPLEGQYYFKDKYLMTVKAFNYPTIKSISNLFDMFKQEQMTVYDILGWFAYINKETPPEYLLEDYQKIKTHNQKLNLLKVFVLSTESTQVEEIYINTLNLIAN